MKDTLRTLAGWGGTIDRRAYALVGLIGFGVKHNLDRLLASFVFHRPWRLFNYWIPLDKAVRITSLAPQDAVFLGTMLLLAIPFMVVGLVLTARRLRGAQLPVWLIVLFFAPFVNLLFFAILCVIPSRVGRDPGGSRSAPRRTLIGRLIPDDALGSAILAIVITLVPGVALVALGVSVLRLYGWGLFVALPFGLGLASVLLYGYHRPRSFGSCYAVACLSLALLGLALFLLAVEGAICLMMAAPITFLLTLMGASLGYLIQSRVAARAETPAVLSCLLLLLPALQGVERRAAFEPAVFAVRTSIDVDAPAETVWRHVIAFTDIFRLGIAYPVRAEIRGSGAGAERRCEFSTGSFVEPIEVWDEPRLLRFSVTSNPPPMEEWTPYAAVRPPHLRGFLVSEGGQFRLAPLPDGRCRLEGTTWYRHTMWPALYWRLWSDVIIHRIHERVLRHIERLATRSAKELRHRRQ